MTEHLLVDLVDLVTDDPNNDEVVLYLVENGPWKQERDDQRLRSIQNRLYNAFDAIVDGHFATRFPDSKRTKFRIQVDCHDNSPKYLDEFVRRFSDLIAESDEYQQAIHESTFVTQLRIVTRADMGRGT